MQGIAAAHELRICTSTKELCTSTRELCTWKHLDVDPIRISHASTKDTSKNLGTWRGATTSLTSNRLSRQLTQPATAKPRPLHVIPQEKLELCLHLNRHCLHFHRCHLRLHRYCLRLDRCRVRLNRCRLRLETQALDRPHVISAGQAAHTRWVEGCAAHRCDLDELSGGGTPLAVQNRTNDTRTDE